jgi:hypothetical protein
VLWEQVLLTPFWALLNTSETNMKLTLKISVAPLKSAVSLSHTTFFLRNVKRVSYVPASAQYKQLREIKVLSMSLIRLNVPNVAHVLRFVHPALML